MFFPSIPEIGVARVAEMETIEDFLTLSCGGGLLVDLSFRFFDSAGSTEVSAEELPVMN